MAHGTHRSRTNVQSGGGAKSRANQGKPPSQRQLRVGELVRHALAEILVQANFRDPALEGQTITVPEVRMSPDLRNATVFVMPLGGRGEEKIVAALTGNSKYIRGQLARKMSQKYIPSLIFTKDKSFDTYGRIDELLRSPEVAPDLVGNIEELSSNGDTEKR